MKTDQAFEFEVAKKDDKNPIPTTESKAKFLRSHSRKVGYTP
jgi:hypothetical protein